MKYKPVFTKPLRCFILEQISNRGSNCSRTIEQLLKDSKGISLRDTGVYSAGEPTGGVQETYQEPQGHQLNRLYHHHHSKSLH